MKKSFFTFIAFMMSVVSSYAETNGCLQVFQNASVVSSHALPTLQKIGEKGRVSSSPTATGPKLQRDSQKPTIREINEEVKEFFERMSRVARTNSDYIADKRGNYYDFKSIEWIKRNPFAYAFFRLAIANGFYEQTHPDLLGVVGPGSGLCTSTCMINVVATIKLSFSHNFDFQSLTSFYQKELLHIQTLANYYFREGIHGLSLYAAGGILQNLLAQEGLGYIPIHRYVLRDPNFSNVIKNYSPDSTKSIWLTAFSDAVDHTRHAIIILFIDHKKNEIYISDPNNPNAVWKRSYEWRRVSGASSPTIYIPHGFPNTTPGGGAYYLDEIVLIKP